MKNKKRNLIISCTLLVIIVGVYFLIPKEKEEIEDTETKVNTNGFLTLMLEQDDGTYQESSSSIWPTSGYIYNNILSKCENGGKLIWNNELKTITLKTDKSDKCYVYFDRYISPIVNSVTVTNTSTSSISVSVNASGGTNNVATYYYSINNGSYTNSSSNTKTFTGLSKGTTYTIKVYVKDTNGVDSAVKTTSAETESEIFLADVCSNGTNLATCIKNYYNEAGQEMSSMYYHTSSLSNSAVDNSYRYTGASPNNYVCFGSDTATCLSDNLYRIIGVFDSEVKLIKSTSYGDYVWSTNFVYPLGLYSNLWSTSDIRSTLNITFLNTINSTWQNKIATHTWKVGGMTTANGFLNGAQTAYNYEVGISSSNTTDNMKIGLMYVSDYYYGSTNAYWSYPGWNSGGNDYSLATDKNWLYLGSDEWTISKNSGQTDLVYGILSNGCVRDTLGIYAEYKIRPTFYLTSSTTYVGGSGTSSDPIRIN